MNPEVKKKWINALRSGKYNQGKSRLKSSSTDGVCRHCCLGVLTELYIGATGGRWLAHAHPSGVTYGVPQAYGYEEKFTITDECAEWAGLDSCDPGIMVGGAYSTLAILNDHKDYTFDEIADIIEEQL